jgi:nucleotide-binding universal stress UspA family protein
VPFRIVVPLDGSRFGERALPTALALAERAEAALDLVTVAVPALQSAPARDDAVTGDESRERGKTRAAEYLDGVAARVRDSGYQGTMARDVIAPGNAARSIVRYLAEVEADLVVMTTHGRGPLQRAWLGSTADGVIRRSPCPVLLLRPPEAAERKKEDEERPPVDLAERPGPFASVLLPLDGSEASERAFDALRPLVAPDAAVHLLRVVPPFVAGGSPYLPHTVRESQDHERVKQGSAQYLERFGGRVEAEGYRVERSVVTAGQPAVAVLRAAEEAGASLIAMSTSGRGGAARLLLGSVADKVVRGAPCPVLLARTPEDA